jgi:hypothetical protein
MDLLHMTDSGAHEPEGVNGLVQAMLLRRLGADPALREILPLLGLASTEAPALTEVLDGQVVTPTLEPAWQPGGGPVTLEQTLADATAALASCQALLVEVASSLNACLDSLGGQGSMPAASGPRTDTEPDNSNQYESGRSA